MNERAEANGTGSSHDRKRCGNDIRNLMRVMGNNVFLSYTVGHVESHAKFGIAV